MTKDTSHLNITGSCLVSLQMLSSPQPSERSLCHCLLERFCHTLLLPTCKPHLLSLLLAGVTFDQAHASLSSGHKPPSHRLFPGYSSTIPCSLWVSTRAGQTVPDCTSLYQPRLPRSGVLLRGRLTIFCAFPKTSQVSVILI